MKRDELRLVFLLGEVGIYILDIDADGVVSLPVNHASASAIT